MVIDHTLGTVASHKAKTGKRRERKKMSKLLSKNTTATIIIAVFLVTIFTGVMPVHAQTILEVNGPPATLTTDSGHLLGSFSPDGSQIVYTGAGGIWVMDSDGSNPHKIYDSGTRPDWGPSVEGYPDGLIALAGTGITIITPDGTLVKNIDTSHTYPGDGLTKTGTHSLDWSQDGSKIAFADNAGTMGIWMINYDGSGLTQLCDYGASEYSPTWSPDGEWIAFTSKHGGLASFQIFKSKADLTTTYVQLTTTGGDYPDWSSEGKIAYHDGTGALHVMDDDGLNDKVVSTGPAKMVAWSPDGKKIAYLNDFSGYVNTRGYPYATIQSAIDDAESGDTISVSTGNYEEGITVIDKNLKIIGLSESNKPVIKPIGDLTGGDSASNAWFLVESGVNFEMSNFVIDGGSYHVYQAIRSHGDTTINNVDFQCIKGSDGGNPYRGIAVSSFGGLVAGGAGSDSHGGEGGVASHLVVTDCTFDQIGRIGVLVKGTESTADIDGITYTGKGIGDWLDYGVEAGAGGKINIQNSEISDCTGVAASDGSTSAGILATTYYGSGTQAIITNNDIHDNTEGIAVGYDESDTSIVEAHHNNFWENDVQISDTVDTVDIEATLNSNTFDRAVVVLEGESYLSTIWSNIQSAIDNAQNGDTIEVSPGTYVENLNLQGKTLHITGSGIDSTVIDASGSDVYAIQNFGASTTISDLTLIGSTNYGFKVSHISGIDLENIKVVSSGKTGIDLNTVTDSHLKNIEVTDTSAGFGIMILDSDNILVEDITTSGNAWGGVSIQTLHHASDGITFSGEFSASETNPLLIEEDPESEGVYYIPTNTQLPEGMTYVVYAFREGDNYKQYYFQETKDSAQTLVHSLVTDLFTYSDMMARSILEENTFYVFDGMQIQTSIDHASDGQTVKVLPGYYAGSLTIPVEITLLGPNHDVDPAGSLDRGNEAIIDGQVTIEADDVTLNGFKLTGGYVCAGYPSAQDVSICYNILTGFTADWGAVHLQGTASGPSYHQCDGGYVGYNTITDITGYGIWTVGNNDVTIEHNYILGVTLNAIEALNHVGTGIQILYNTIEDPGQRGISYWAEAGGIIRYNTITGSGWEAIFTDTGATIEQNDILDSGMNGIEAAGNVGTGIEILDNTITNPAYSGINYWAAPGGVIRGNTITHGGYGDTQHAGICSYTVVDVEDNTLNDIAYAPGIWLLPFASTLDDHSVVKNNDISDIQWQGIANNGQPYAEITYNTLTNCNNYGIDGTGDWDYASIHLEPQATDCLIDGNKISDGINGIQTWADHTTITNNLIFDMGKNYPSEKVVGDRTYKNSAIIIGSNWGSGDLDPTGIVILNNMLHDNAFNLFYSPDLSNGVDAKQNYWGTIKKNDILAKISSNVNIEPYLDSVGKIYTEQVPTPPPTPTIPNVSPKADAGSNQKILVGKTVYLDGSKSSDPDGTIQTWSWSFGDGATASGKQVQHKYTTVGQYTVKLTVTDNSGASASDTCTVTVTEPPAPVSNEVTEQITGEVTDYVVDAVKEANTTVKLNTVKPVSVSVLKYEGNPHPEDPMPTQSLPIYIDVELSDLSAVQYPVYVEVHYTDKMIEGKNEASLGLYYWKDNQWRRCSNTGVDTDRNIVWAYMTEDEVSGSPILAGYTPKPAEFTVTDLSITPGTITVGDTVTITVTVTNNGEESGDYSISLDIGDWRQTVTGTLAGGESESRTYQYIPDSAGAYNVAVGGLTASFNAEAKAVIKQPTPANFVVSNLQVSPENVTEGETVQVTVDVANTGEESGSYTVQLMVDGVTVDTSDITLSGGASTTVAFSVQEDVGSHSIQIEDLTAQFTVSKTSAPFEISVGFIAGVLTIVAVIGVFVYRSRKQVPTP